ncbi:MAG: cytochrome c biogenesis protein CcsA [Desulfurococcales archaeon]|nr:cytochrome c biogenesis protein CcsA [Desulfurococcales archaeon]
MSLGLHYAVVLPYIGLIGLILALISDARGDEERGRNLLRASVILFLVGWFIYMIPFVTLDYRLAEVAKNENDDLNLALRIAASWSGGGGSLYLYTTMIALTVLYIIRAGNDTRKYRIASGLTLLIALASAILNGAFDVLPPGYGGFGINPLLKSYWIIPHPLTTFGGYALLLGGSLIFLFTGDKLRAMSVFLAGWGLLTFGITFGAMWSYETLGWGGYWGWDPVEISELTVWLAATGFLHMIGPLDGLRRSLAALTASSALLAPYVTRSGLSPLHSFAAANIGSLILLIGAVGFLVITGREIANYSERLNFNDLKRRLRGLEVSEASVIVAGTALIAMAIFVYASLAIPSILVAAGREAKVPTMAEGIHFYHPVLYTLFIVSIIFVPGYFLSRDLGRKGFYGLTLTGVITALSVAVAVALRRIDFMPQAPETTRLQAAVGLSLSSIVAGALTTSILVHTLFRRRRGLNIRDTVLKLIHLSMLIAFIGILLSGTFAFNDKYFETYQIKMGQTTSAGPVELTLMDYGFEPNPGHTDLRVYLENTTFEALAIDTVHIFYTDLGAAMREVLQAESIVEDNESLKALLDTLSQGPLIVSVGNMSLNTSASIEYVQLTRGLSRIIVDNRTVSLALFNVTAGIQAQPNMTQSGGLLGASVEAAMVADRLVINAPIKWEEYTPGFHDYYVITLNDPFTIEFSENVSLRVNQVEIYVGGQNQTTPPFTIKGNNTIIIENPFMRISKGTLRIGDYSYSVPFNLTRGLYLYILVQTGNAPILAEALNSPLLKAVVSSNLQAGGGGHGGAGVGTLSLPKSVPSGDYLWIKLRVGEDGDEHEVIAKIRFEANGEASGIHGLVNPVLLVHKGLSDIYIVVTQPVQQGFFGVYHEPLLYYVKMLQEELPPQKALLATSVMAIGYNIAEIRNVPEQQLGLVLEQALVDMYLTASHFDPNNSSLKSEGLVVKVKVVPGVNLVWAGAISMGALGLISSAMYILTARKTHAS